MTCFSIQKSLRIVLCLALNLSVFAVFPAHAQPEPPTELTKKREAEDLAEKELKEGKSDSPIVIELFTASDCTACIFADRMLYDTMKDKNVIALSCHIKDVGALRNSSTGNTLNDNTMGGPMDPCVFRQWAYSMGRNTKDVIVNIPTFYFNGDDRVDAPTLNYFDTTFNSFHYLYKNKILEVMMRWKDNDTITIHLPQSIKKTSVKPNASVWLVRYKNMEVERVNEGVNKGRVLRFSNIIQDIKHIAKWRGEVRTIDVDVVPPTGGNDRGGYAILVSEMLGDPYVAAGSLIDYPLPADLKAAAEKKARAKAAAENKPYALPSEKQPKPTPVPIPQIKKP